MITRKLEAVRSQDQQGKNIEGPILKLNHFLISSLEIPPRFTEPPFFLRENQICC